MSVALTVLGYNLLWAQSTQEVLITGQVSPYGVGVSDTAIDIIVFYPLTDEAFNLPLDDEGQFELRFAATLPGECLLVQGEYAAIFPYRPGDSLDIVLPADTETEQDWHSKLQVAGPTAQFARSAFAYQAFFGHMPASINAFRRKMYRADPDEMLRYADSVRATHLQMAQQFLADHPTPPAMQTWIRRRAALGYMYIMKIYPGTLERRLKDQPMPVLPARFETFYEEYLVEEWTQDDWLSREFWFDIENHFTYTFVTKPIFDEQQWEEVQFVELDSLFYNRWDRFTIPSYLAERAIANYTLGRLGMMDLNPIARHGEFLESKLKESPYWPSIQEAYARAQPMLKHEGEATFPSLGNAAAESIMDSIIAQHKGKVVYLDIWATWCGPCRQNMAGSKQLHHALQDVPVEFVYLCMESQKAEWESLVETYALGGTHYYLDPAQSKAFIQHMNLRGYPTYMIVDKHGTLVDRQAPPPTDTRMKPLLLNLAE